MNDRQLGAACAALIVAGWLSSAAFAQASHDPVSQPATHADVRASKDQSKADKKAHVAQARADKKKADAQADADKSAADARLKDAKKE